VKVGGGHDIYVIQVMQWMVQVMQICKGCG